MRALTLWVLVWGLGVGGCAKLPAEALIVQEKIGESIEAARRNQLRLIDEFAEAEKTSRRVAFEAGIPKAIEEEFGEGNASFELVEVGGFLKEYGRQLQAGMGEVDEKAAELRHQTNEFFDEMWRLNDVNLDLLRSVVELNQTYRAALERAKSRSRAVQAAFGDDEGR
jgi:hypothetical protein